MLCEHCEIRTVKQLHDGDFICSACYEDLREDSYEEPIYEGEEFTDPLHPFGFKCREGDYCCIYFACTKCGVRISGTYPTCEKCAPDLPF